MTHLSTFEIPKNNRRFKIALSFPGEKREYVKNVADLLIKILGENTVFYDNYFEHEIARFSADLYLMDIYRDQSDLIAVFLCAEYQAKEWCGLEWNVIRDLRKQHRISDIMPFKFDNADIDGLLSVDGYVDINSRPPEAIVDLIIKRLKANEIGTASAVTKSVYEYRKDEDTTLSSHNAYYAIERGNLSIIDYIFLLFNKIYGELNFIPLSILKNIYPLKDDNKHTSTYYSVFSFNSNNENLYHYFNSVIGNSKPDSLDNTIFSSLGVNADKFKYVIEKLTSNLIFNISDLNSSKQVDIYYHSKNKEPENIISYYNIFLFKQSILLLDKNYEDVESKIKAAYINYKIGNYNTAIELYQDISLKAQNENKYITYFICQYNLCQLAIFIRNDWQKEASNQQILQVLKDIDLKKIAEKLNSNSSNSLYEFIETGDFYTIPNNEINLIVDKIVDIYYSQLNGGASSNNHAWDLLCQFAQLELFINSNHIIYDKFSEFDNLFKKVIEGLFASHAISRTHNSRLQTFDDYWVHKIIYYGDYSTIIKYFNRYKLKCLDYRQTGFENDSFYDLARNFLSNAITSVEIIEKHKENGNHVFLDKYSQIFENMFALAAVMNISSVWINDIAKSLIEFIKNDTVIIWHKYRAVDIFIRRQGSKIDSQILIQIFNVSLGKGKLHERGFLQSILNQIAKKKVFNISQQMLYSLLEKSFTKCDECQNLHSKDDIVSLYKTVNKKNKKIFK